MDDLRPGDVPDEGGDLVDQRLLVRLEVAGVPDLYAYARLLAEEKRRSPGSDVMSILPAQVDEDGGSETLRNGLPGGLTALPQHLDAPAALRADPSLLRRTSALELDGPPALLRSNFQRGVERLPIRWAAA